MPRKEEVKREIVVDQGVWQKFLFACRIQGVSACEALERMMKHFSREVKESFEG